MTELKKLKNLGGPTTDVAGLCERLMKVNPWSDMDWPEVLRKASAWSTPPGRRN
jgi:hypothetical protein